MLGKDTATQSLEVQAAVGYMPQRFGLYEDLTALENLNLYADLQGVPPQERPHRYEELMTMTGLAPFTKPSGRPSLRGDEAEAGLGLHAGAGPPIVASG